MAYVLIQRFTPKHKNCVPEILSRISKIPVSEVTGNRLVESDHVYVIPSNLNMTLVRGFLQLQSPNFTPGLHKPIDYFLRSLANEKGEQAIGVLLSGTASDGILGLRAVKAAGGITFAQNGESAKLPSLHHRAVEAGVVDFVLAPRGIAEELVRRGRHPYLLEGSRPPSRATSRLQRASSRVARAEDRRFANMIVEVMPDALVVLDEHLRIKTANRAFYQTFQLSPRETENQFIYDLGNGEWSIPRLRTLLERIPPQRTKLVNFRLQLNFPRVGQKCLLLNVRQLDATNDHPVILLAFQDITDQVQAESDVRLLTGRLLRLQDDERRRIARDLHDSTGQRLAALAINLSLVSQAAGGLPPKPREALKECFSLLEQVAGEVRTLSYLLHPPLLDEVGLAAAVRWYADGVTQRCGIRVHLDAAQEFGRLPSEIETALFRIVQEALTNIHLHSGSKTARIQLDRSAEEVTLSVSDDGKGIPPEKLEPTAAAVGPGVGIAGMRERLKQLGGQLEIVSDATGTILKARLPVPGAA